jgi:hypothetical protein
MSKSWNSYKYIFDIKIKLKMIYLCIKLTYTSMQVSIDIYPSWLCKSCEQEVNSWSFFVLSWSKKKKKVNVMRTTEYWRDGWYSHIKNGSCMSDITMIRIIQYKQSLTDHMKRFFTNYSTWKNSKYLFMSHDLCIDQSHIYDASLRQNLIQ